MDITSYLLGKNASGGGGGADLNDYFTKTIRNADGSTPGYAFMIKRIPDDTIVSGTTLDKAFYLCAGLTEIPLLDTSAVTTFVSCFEGCKSLLTIPLINTEKATNFNRMFYGCESLTTIPVLSVAKVTNMQNMFSRCSSLSNDGLNNILKMCSNVSSSYHVNYRTLSYIGISSTYYSAETIQALPNYQDFLDAGWTIGY